MSKSYTMREMKSIVDYLVEHRAYGEIKGRKMWMSFASSKLTQRTWQSLKETFIKRILPDINNPYYKLTTEQICSFRQGMDFTQKNKDKLVLQPTNDKTNSSSSSPTILKEIMEGNRNADADSPKSVEPHHYNTIEELQKDLEVSDKEREEESVEIGHENQDLMTEDLSAKNCGTDIETSVAILDKIPENASSSSQEVTSPNLDHNKKLTLVEKSRNCVESQILVNKNKSYNKEKSDVTQHQKTDNEKADKNTTKISPVIMQKKASTTPDTHLPNNPEEFMNGIKRKEISKENHLSVPISAKNKAKKIRSRSHSKNVSSDLESGKAIKGNSQTQVATYNSHENQGSNVCSDDQNLNEDQVDNETSTRKITKVSVPSKAVSSFVEHADKPGCSKYTMDDERVWKKPIINGIKTNNKSVKIDDKTKNEVVVLNSYSDSDSDNVTDAKEQRRNEKRKMKRKSANQAALAKMLGFSNVKDNPKPKETTDENVECTETRVPSRYISGSEISDTSDDEDRIEVRPKKTRCCNFKPSQPQELYTAGGGLFCSFGNSTYPIVMNGKILTDDQYLFMEENHTKTLKEEREFWKTKFLDQEKKTDQVLELLQRMGKKIESQEKVVDELRKVIADFNDEDNAPVLHRPPSVELPKPKKDKRIQIRFTTKNQDVRLKGEWSNICKEFNEMVKIFKSVSPTIEDNETTTKQCDKAIDNIPVIVINEEAADNVTEEEAHQNVSKIESEIFNQIAKIDAAEKEKQEKQQKQQEQSNVTLRRRRPIATDKRTLSSEEGAPSNRVRSRSPQKKPTIDKVNKDKDKDNKVKDIGLKKKRKPIRQSSRLSNQKRDIVTETKNDESSDDDDISIVPQTETSSSVKSFLLSESTRDYQSSDKCQSELYNKKKRKYSFSVSYKDRNKFKRNLRRRIESDFTNDASSESSNITGRHTFKPFAEHFENSTLTNGVQETGKSHNAMQCINETYVISNHTQSSSQATTFTSSSITLPPSPGISSVENLSSDHTLKTNKSCQKCTISNIDVSMPLIRQDGWVKRRTYRSVSEQTTLYQRKELASANYTDSRINTHIQQKSALSDTLLNKVANVNIVGSPTISASLNKKMHDLLLESAKKTKSAGLANSSEIIVEQEECMINAHVIKAKKKVEPKKRSSTPLKRKSTRKSKPADIEPIIEERMEYCSKSRSSLPSVKPLQQNNTKTIHKCNKIKNRQGIQKNVIKVKILRPKRKDLKVKNKYDTNSSKASLCGSLNIDMRHSDELAHNHSETCLFVDEQTAVVAQPQRSQTALPQTLARDTSLNCSPKNFNIETVNRDATVFKPDFLNTPSNGTLLNNEGNVGNILPTATPMYGSYDSLITNDLSSHVTSPQSQSRNSPWYLLTEDETSKSNTISPQQIPLPIPPAIAQLFPITCAVPNLSTITEASREPDESQKKENIKH